MVLNKYFFSFQWTPRKLACLSLISFLFLIPKIFNKTISSGQIGKQTYSASMAFAYESANLKGFFPIRHFLEIYHPKVIPWAEEFPIYTISVALIFKLTQKTIPLIIIGRMVSSFFFILLLFGGFYLSKEIGEPLNALPFLLSLFPVFRIYAVSFMPDMAMTSLCLWGFYFTFKDKFFKAAMFFFMASLFKYYAVFFTLGALFYALFKKKERSTLFALIFSTLPIFCYLCYFLIYNIPNPIRDNYQNNHYGHFSSISLLFSLKFLTRLFTWLFIKNPTIPGTLLALIGFFKFKTGPLKVSIVCFSLAQLVYIFIFAHGYYIHDYYSLSTTLLTSILASFGLNFLFMQKPLKYNVLLTFLIFSQIAFSLSITQRALRPQLFYKELSDTLKNLTQKNDPILIIGDRFNENILYEAQRTGWMINTKDWKQYKNSPLLKKNIKWIFVYFVDHYQDSSFDNIKAALLNVYPHIKIKKQEKLSPQDNIPEIDYYLLEVTSIDAKESK